MSRIVVVGALWTSIWWLIIGALIAPVIPGGWLTIATVFVLAVAPLFVLVQRFRGAHPGAFIRLFVFRPFWYVQLSAPIVALGGVIGFLVGAPVGAAVIAGRWAIFIVSLLCVAGVLIGYAGSRVLRVKRLQAQFPGLPIGLDGMRIVQVSDVHVGPHTSRRFLTRISNAVNGAKADLIAFTGDQVDDFAGDVAYFGKAFGSLSAPLGMFAVAGNHDVYAGWPEVRQGLEALGVTVLVNDAVEIKHNAASFWLAGTGDPAGLGSPLGRVPEVAPDIKRTLARVPAGAFTIALAHNPALWPQLAERGVHLTLSGHTHYGQLSIPHMGWSLASLFLEHAMGSHVRGQSVLYINPGTNYWGLPLRIGAVPEVTVVTLGRGKLALGDDSAHRLQQPTDERETARRHSAE
jgi:predicted MPP superfamily phosphohydrolase